MDRGPYKLAGLLVLLAVLVNACTIARGSGDIVSETRDVANFDKIALSGTGDVIVILGEEESLTIETDDNLMKHLNSEVRGSTLHLDVDERTNIYPTRLVYTVVMRELKGLSISGSGTFKGSDIKSERLEISISGSGEIELDGETNEQEIEISGSGKYRTGNLHSENADVAISGSGEVTIWATGTLQVDISGSGSVDYYGNPAIESSISGSGELNQIGGR